MKISSMFSNMLQIVLSISSMELSTMHDLVDIVSTFYSGEVINICILMSI